VKPSCVSPELRSSPVASTCQKVIDLWQSKSQTTADGLADGLKRSAQFLREVTGRKFLHSPKGC